MYLSNRYICSIRLGVYAGPGAGVYRKRTPRAQLTPSSKIFSKRTYRHECSKFKCSSREVTEIFIEHAIENLKATVESTGQTVTGRLIFAQVIVQTQAVQYSHDVNGKMSKIGLISRFESDEPLEIMNDKFTEVVIPEIGFRFEAYIGCKILIGVEPLKELPEFLKEVLNDYL